MQFTFRYAMKQSLSTRKPTPSPSCDLIDPTQTTLHDSETHSDTEDDADTDSENENTERNMANGNTLENHIPLEVLINTATIPEVTTKTESVEDHNSYNEHAVGSELTKPLEIDAVTANVKTINNSISTNIAANLQIDVSKEVMENTGLIDKVVGDEVDESDDPIKEEFEIDTKLELIGPIQLQQEIKKINLHKDVSIEDMEKENTALIDKAVSDEEHEGDDPIKKFETDTNLEIIGATQLKTDTKIKKEPEENIVKELEDLGKDFTVSILDVEDPFVSIEISDSSDDEDENMNTLGLN